MENTTKTSSCLAITEKKTHKPGGCVGVFFQLFDWNRRSAKKKLFSKKFLPPARAKEGSKKFRADEKMPSSKLHLIADENSGGFPNMKNDSTRIVNFTKQHEMRSPSLVARLMGLESMPVAKKALFSEACEKGFEKRSMKSDSRPPNLQKTDDSDKKMATRIGTEAMPFKSALSRSRKNYHPPKLPSPIKSPRFSLGRSVTRTSRLIEAAARILEPGLQATSRAKSGIAYSNYETHASIDSAIAGEYNAAKSFMGNISDESCDNFMNFGEFGQNMDGFPSVYHSLASNSGNSFSRETARCETIPPLSSLKPERDLLFERRREGRIFVDSDKNKINASFDDERVTERGPLDHQYRSSSASQPRKLRKHDSSSFPFKHGNQSLNQISPGRDRISARSKPSNLQSGRVSSSANAPGGARDSLAFSRGTNGGGRARVPIKLENGKVDMVRRTTNGREDPLPQLRTSVSKRRTTGPSGSIDCQCDSAKQRDMACSKSTGRRLGFDACSMNHYSCNESKLVDQEEAKGVYQRSRDFEFQNDLNNRVSATMEGEIVDKRGISSYERKYSLGGDAIGALLEQKLKELTSQEEDESTTSFSAKRSTAIILQELIAALTADPPRSRDGSVAETNMACDAEAAETEMSMTISKNVNQSSPGSVLEASFSSGGLDDGSGSRLQAEIIDDSTSTDHFQLPEVDVLNSASSFNKIGSRMLSGISLMLQTINLSGVRLTGSKLSYAEEVLLHIQLLFGNVTRHFLNESINSLLTRPLFLDELKNISDGEASEKERNTQRGFLFDVLIECLDSKYSHFCNFGFNAWTRLPACLNARKMVREVEDEVKKWKSFSQMSLDEMIELEMSQSLGKWIEFGTKGFETGAAIEQDILQDLVGEIVIDLLVFPSNMS